MAGKTPTTGSLSRTQACVQDLIAVAEKPNGQSAKHLNMKTRVDQFFDDLNRFLEDWPNRDGGIYVSQLEEALTKASTEFARTAPATSDLLEKAIDYVGQNRRRRR